MYQCILPSRSYSSLRQTIVKTTFAHWRQRRNDIQGVGEQGREGYKEGVVGIMEFTSSWGTEKATEAKGLST